MRVIKRLRSISVYCSNVETPGGGAVCIRNIPSRMTESGIQPLGNVETMTSNLLYRVSKKSVALLLLPLCGKPLGSDSAHGRAIKFETKSEGN